MREIRKNLSIISLLFVGKVRYIEGVISEKFKVKNKKGELRR